MGVLPGDEELAAFKTILSETRKLPTHFVRDIIMKAPTGDIMKSMMRSILAYSYMEHGGIAEMCLAGLSMGADVPQILTYQLSHHCQNG